MKNWLLLVFAAFSIIFISGCGNDDDPEPVPVVDTYSVTYSLSVFGGYDSLEISYFAPHGLRSVKLNPKTPWSQNLVDYRLLDSVAMNVKILPLANRILNYEWEVKITKAGDLINLNGDSESMTTGDNPEYVYIDWREIIQETNLSD